MKIHPDGTVSTIDDKTPYGLALAEVIKIDKTDTVPYLSFRNKKGEVIAGNCFEA